MREALTLNPWVFGLLFVMWFAAYMTGRALADSWRPAWQAAIYAAMLGLVDRFLVFALYEGELLSIGGYLIDAAILIGFGWSAFRLTQVHRMVSQYPWLYERTGPFSWREKRG
jgi:hypothetical protein